MGKVQSKRQLINTLTTRSFRLSTAKEESGDPSEQVQLIRFRSNSLDSNGTALSFGAGLHQQCHITPARSCSLDNLCSATADYRNSDKHRTDSGKAFGYHTSDSVSDSRSTDCHAEKNPPKNPGRLSHSLPREVQRELLMDSNGDDSAPVIEDSRCHSASPQPVVVANRERDLDAFSDNFVSLECAAQENISFSQDSRLPVKPILKDSQLQHIKDSSEASAANGEPVIPPDVLGKLSDEDIKKLSQFIMCVCTTVGQRLTQPMQEASVAPENEEGSASQSLSDRTPSPSSSKHVRIVDTGSRGEGSDRNSSSRGERERVKHRHRSHRRRPNSLPPEYLKDGISAESQCTDDSDELHDVVRSRSRSHDGYYHHKCKAMDHTTHHTRQLASRKKTRRKLRNEDTAVDPSLDDNCPGAPENRVRKHKHHHHHVVCRRCLEGLKDETVSPRSRRHKHKHRHSEHFGELDVSQQLNFGQNEGSYHVITLQDMKNSGGKLLEEGGGFELVHEGKLNNHHRSRRHRHCQNSEEVEGLRIVPPECGQMGWHELAYTGKSRTGRDSPHTDMAVWDLDLNSPRMCQPLEISDMNNMPLGNAESTVQHFYLHDHHHYHHIIHHNKPS